MIDRFERFSLAIAEINRSWHKIAGEELAKFDLKASHVTYILALYRNPEGLTAPKLAETCDRDKADVSRMLSILEAKGLVARDGTYRGCLRLTPDGQIIAKELSVRTELAVERAAEGLSLQQREALYAALDIIIKNLRKITQEGLK